MFAGVWGVSDEDLLRRAHQEFVAQGDRPFFALVFSSSNHTPFEYPPGRIAPYDEEPATVNNAIRYADYAIGEFFRLARQAEYYDNTLFLVVADHDTRVFGADLVPIDHYHVPGLILGPGLTPRRIDRIASQVDLAPTLLSLMGIDQPNPMIGIDLLQAPADRPGRAFMQYYTTNAYLQGDQVVIHPARRPPAQFTYRDGRLRRTELDPELALDALAHIRLPGLLYRQRAYALEPAPTPSRLTLAGLDRTRSVVDAWPDEAILP